MEMTPQAVRSTGFKLVKRGYDPEEVDAFKEQVAGAVEYAQNQATAMEARARAAVAKLQEVSQQVQSGAAAAPAAPAGDTEVISRTLLLAQRTADQTVAEARTEADGILTDAREEAGRVLDGARTMAAKAVDDARFEARRAVDDERVKAENEVQALLARRDFLLSDVDHLEQYIQAQRERLRDAAVQLQEMVERVPGGLADMRRPLLSASGEELPPGLLPAPGAYVAAGDSTGEILRPTAIDADEPTQALEAPEPEPTIEPQLDPQEQVWRMLDAEVAQGRTAGGSIEDITAEITGEMPRPTIPPVPDPFHIDDEELQ
ncbi:MAG: DivIVA domain-containing protein [Ilumatobacteraceae bacterium]